MGFAPQSKLCYHAGVAKATPLPLVATKSDKNEFKVATSHPFESHKSYLRLRKKDSQRLSFLVEIMGFEPTAFALRTRRSTN